MMRLRDTLVLAATKLRTHRIRTAIVTGVSGILFGLLIAIIVVAQGVFDSADRFGKVGLSDRGVVMFGAVGDWFEAQNRYIDPVFVSRVEESHKQMVSKKQAAAKKFNVPYDPKIEDPSPVGVDPDSGRRMVMPEMAHLRAVALVEAEVSREKAERAKTEKHYHKYPSAKEIGPYSAVSPKSGALTYMKDGKELSADVEKNGMPDVAGATSFSPKQLYGLEQTLAESFVSNKSYDPESGELPVVLPFGDAERLLGYKSLPKDASSKDQRQRVVDVHSRVGEVKMEYCYRNEASAELLGQARAIRAEMEKNKNNRDYQKPSLIYAVPDETTCGPVEVASDTRTAEEKRADANMENFEKEIGEYIGDPQQQKFTFRGVGVSADAGPGRSSTAITTVIQSLLSVPLGYDSWNIPLGLFREVPEEHRPTEVFGLILGDKSATVDDESIDNMLLEFGDIEEARDMINRGVASGDFYAMPFGNAKLLVSEMRSVFDKVLFWVVLVTGVFAVIILSGLTGRTIADSRKETAVFRAIGASRGNIAGIYIVYTLLFSLRVVIFAFVLGGALALIANTLWADSATVGAELAYGAVNSGEKFSFLGLSNVYLPILAGVIMLVGLVSVIIPILRNVRRSPISDMRDE